MSNFKYSVTLATFHGKFHEFLLFISDLYILIFPGNNTFYWNACLLILITNVDP